MKRSDIAMIVLIAGLSMLLAFAVGSSIPALKAPRVGTSVDTIEKMNSDVKEPNSEVFNSNAINPTVETIIGSSGSSDASKQNK
ncbi:MAG: hypothetical protein LP071_03175 [Candidatus Nanogingivalaceae bacterium]|nr:hypothetical protein [Candidatus Nanogingivalaceae bacterium]